MPLDSFGVRTRAIVGGAPAIVMSVAALGRRFPDVRRLPVGLRIVLENLLRHEDGDAVTADHIEAVARRASRWGTPDEISFQPSRIVMQDYSGLVALVDIATMRDRVREAGGDAASVNPVKPVVLVVDHSLVLNHTRTQDAAERNLSDEYAQNLERYEFLKWAQASLGNVRIVPPGNGIIHQINLEHLAEVVTRAATTGVVHPETQIGTDSHTTMINGIGVLGWGVGGIEAEAAMLGEPVSMLVPDVVGVRLTGRMRPGILATDVALTVTERLRRFGVVDRFVEFFGPGVPALSAGDRATIANMAPEYGATCGLFPVDREVLRYLDTTGRDPAAIAAIADYVRLSGIWDDADDCAFADIVEIDLSAIGRSVAGPKRPHERVSLGDVGRSAPAASHAAASHAAAQGALRDGDVVIAAITSCTNTSNAHGMIAAGLLARNAVRRGMSVAPFVKTSLSPGSRAVAEYLRDAGLLDPLAALGFDVAGFGCATCVGNSGPLNEGVEDAVAGGGLAVAAVLSGNRNFEGRIHPKVTLNYLMSPALVVAHALAGTVRRDLDGESVGPDRSGAPVFLRDLWPDDAEIEALVGRWVTARLYGRERDIYEGGPRWDALPASPGVSFPWRGASTYVGPSPFVAAPPQPSVSILGAAPLLVLGDDITTDQISPVGPIPAEGPAADFLRSRGIARADFNSYGARRGNADIMARGTFAHPRLVNAIASPTKGPVSVHAGVTMPIFDAAQRHRRDGTPLVVFAGRNYGAGSARDWAAKGTLALGIRAVIAESFERIHRANLALMGVLPLQLVDASTSALGLDAASRVSVTLPGGVAPRQMVEVVIEHPGRGTRRVQARARIDTAQEARYFREGGVLPAVMRRLTGDAHARLQQTEAP